MLLATFFSVCQIEQQHLVHTSCFDIICLVLYIAPAQVSLSDYFSPPILQRHQLINVFSLFYSNSLVVLLPSSFHYGLQ